MKSNKVVVLLNDPSSGLWPSSPSRGEGNGVRGFTLIELLVVVLIIGILAAVAVPQYQLAVAKSRFTQAKVIAQSLAEAEEVYYLANEKYTQDFNDLDITIGGEISENSGFRAYRFYKWGNCRLVVDNGRAATLCTVTVPSGSVTYWIGLKHSTDTSRKCLADGNTEKPAATDISYRICEQDTGNPSSKVVFGGTSYGWNYK